MHLDATPLEQKRRQLLVFELVGLFRSALAWQQSWQTLALEQCLSDIENRARHTKGLGSLHNRTTFLLDAAQHLVFDLNQIVRIEECTVAKESIGYSLGMRMAGTLCAQGLPTACMLA